MSTTRLQIRIPTTWIDKMKEAAIKAGHLEPDVQGKPNAINTWVKSLIAAQIGETQIMVYHQLKEEFARCVHGELENFREVFFRHIAPDESALHQATYDLGSILQDIPKGSIWQDGLENNHYDIFEWKQKRLVREQVHEIILRAVMHSVNYLAFGDIRIGGGSPPTVKARHSYDILAAHESNRRQRLESFSWIDKLLYAGQSLCLAVQNKDGKRDAFARDCSDLVSRARKSMPE